MKTYSAICPQCQQVLLLNASHVGKRLRCGMCGYVFSFQIPQTIQSSGARYPVSAQYPENQDEIWGSFFKTAAKFAKSCSRWFAGLAVDETHVEEIIVQNEQISSSPETETSVSIPNKLENNVSENAVTFSFVRTLNWLLFQSGVNIPEEFNSVIARTFDNTGEETSFPVTVVWDGLCFYAKILVLPSIHSNDRICRRYALTWNLRSALRKQMYEKFQNVFTAIERKPELAADMEVKVQVFFSEKRKKFVLEILKVPSVDDLLTDMPTAEEMTENAVLENTAELEVSEPVVETAEECEQTTALEILEPQEVSEITDESEWESSFEISGSQETVEDVWSDSLTEQEVAANKEKLENQISENVESESTLHAAYCPKCFQKLNLNENDLGRKIQCGACWYIFTVQESMLCTIDLQAESAEILEHAIETLKLTQDMLSERAAGLEFQPRDHLSATYCPKCFRKLRLDEGDLGRKIQCGACWYIFTVQESIQCTSELQDRAVEILEEASETLTQAVETLKQTVETLEQTVEIHEAAAAAIQEQTARMLKQAARMHAAAETQEQTVETQEQIVKISELANETLEWAEETQEFVLKVQEQPVETLKQVVETAEECERETALEISEPQEIVEADDELTAEMTEESAWESSYESTWPQETVEEESAIAQIPNVCESIAEIPEPLKIVDSANVRELVGELLRTHFKDGIRPNYSMHLNRLRRLAEGKIPEDIDLPELIRSLGVTCEQRVYFLTDETKQKLFGKMCELRESGHRMVYFSELYEKEQAEFVQMNIYSWELLQKYC
ncbi:MAG: hypothetical protein J6J31_13830, partial [Thermoguttaceae bacterium]|nr:hypothetical protein [Thermoguttaceae bacterium]